jgi:hypothetical protein
LAESADVVALPYDTQRSLLRRCRAFVVGRSPGGKRRSSRPSCQEGAKVAIVPKPVQMRPPLALRAAFKWMLVPVGFGNPTYKSLAARKVSRLLLAAPIPSIFSIFPIGPSV